MLLVGAVLELGLKYWRVCLVALVVLAVAAGLTYERVTGYEQGKDAAVQTIDKANDEEMQRAQAAAKTVDDCVAAGGVWNRDVGVCNHATGQ